MYYLLDPDQKGEPKGPFTADTLKAMLKGGMITEDYVAASDGGTRWIPLNELLQNTPVNEAKTPESKSSWWPFFGAVTIILITIAFPLLMMTSETKEEKSAHEKKEEEPLSRMKRAEIYYDLFKWSMINSRGWPIWEALSTQEKRDMFDAEKVKEIARQREAMENPAFKNITSLIQKKIEFIRTVRLEDGDYTKYPNENSYIGN